MTLPLVGPLLDDTILILILIRPLWAPLLEWKSSIIGKYNLALGAFEIWPDTNVGGIAFDSSGHIREELLYIYSLG
jgi:hypothetical protein